MPTEVATLIGEIVDGRYRLGNLIHYSASGAVLETTFGPEALPAVIKIREGRAEDLDALTVRWRSTLELQHPNVIRVFATGTSMVNGVPIAYLVTEHADESLENVLGERALTVDETQEVLLPTVAALQYLHREGYQHSRLEASKLLAVGEQLKLSCDSAVRLRDGESPAEDLRALGFLIVEALTQKVSATEEALEAMPPRLSEIVRHCLDPDPATRWTVDEVDRRLREPSATRVTLVDDSALAEPWAGELVTPEEPEAEQPSEIYSSVAAPERRPVIVQEDSLDYDLDRPSSPLDVEWRETIRPRRLPTELDEEESPRLTTGRRKLIYCGIGAVAAVALAVAFMRPNDAGPVTPATSQNVVKQAPTVQPADVREKPAEPARTESTPKAAVPVQPAPLSAPTPAPATVAAQPAAGGWSVIVAAYNSKEAADKRVRALTKRWPKFDVAITEPRSEKTRYLITLGHGLPQAEAEALRKRALSSGMPRDTYIKKVM